MAFNIDKIVSKSYKIRTFEYALLTAYSKGLIPGTVHTCVGQELAPAILSEFIDINQDACFATHRGHGLFLAFTNQYKGLICELLGREGAVCLGRGGSQHLNHKNFFSNGIQGAGSLQAVGFAWAQKLQKTNAIAVAQIGDGTFGSGALHEAFTLASLLSAPVLFLVEYNGWAQSTDVKTVLPGNIAKRLEGFGITTKRCSDLNLDELYTTLRDSVEFVRSGKPLVLVVETRRLLAHSKGDDDRDKSLIEKQWKEDPVSNWLDNNPGAKAIVSTIDNEISDLLSMVEELKAVDTDIGNALPPIDAISSMDIKASTNNVKIVDQLNAGLHGFLASQKAVFLGEDIADPYGGAFKVSRGLSTTYPESVFSTPISEAGIVGLANGSALAGFKAVAEIMFADFATLALDQLLNSAAKFYHMFGQKTVCPVTCRIVSGGKRGYGATHSQSVERLFCGEAGLRVVACSHRHNIEALFKRVLNDDAPVVFVENKSLYARKTTSQPPLDMEFVPINGEYPPLYYRFSHEEPEYTIVTYGEQAIDVEKAILELYDMEEIAGDYFILTSLSPLEGIEQIVASTKRSRKLLIVEPHIDQYGISASVTLNVMKKMNVAIRVETVSAEVVSIPCAKSLEQKVLPSYEKILVALMCLSGGKANTLIVPAVLS